MRSGGLLGPQPMSGLGRNVTVAFRPGADTASSIIGSSRRMRVPSHRVGVPNSLSTLDQVPVRVQWRCAGPIQGPAASPVALGSCARP